MYLQWLVVENSPVAPENSPVAPEKFTAHHAGA